MNEAPAATPDLRRGSVAWQGRRTWLVFDASDAQTVRAYPVRRLSQVFATDVAIQGIADELLTRLKSPVYIRTAKLHALPRAGLAVAGELSGPAMCVLSQRLVRLAADRRVERKWAADGRHRRANADTERSAI